MIGYFFTFKKNCLLILEIRCTVAGYDLRPVVVFDICFITENIKPNFVFRKLYEVPPRSWNNPKNVLPVTIERPSFFSACKCFQRLSNASNDF